MIAKGAGIAHKKPVYCRKPAKRRHSPEALLLYGYFKQHGQKNARELPDGSWPGLGPVNAIEEDRVNRP
ncbi:hypothetical protein ACKF11_00975 [Methylobacillus sp. Pita2]|uniref:hypothetical protein n=1 Tax=Methylobacillus sp. Pita2 TaxID=3383245 RepID=UPI0038B506FC